MALGQLGAVRPMDQRNVGHHRHGPAKRVIDVLLTSRVVEVIVTANDVGHAHIVVVDNDSKHVGRGAIRSEQYEIIEVLVLPHDAALDLILDHGLARERRLQTDYWLDTRRRLSWIAVTPASVVAHGAAFALCRFAHLSEFLRTGIATIRLVDRE